MNFVQKLPTPIAIVGMGLSGKSVLSLLLASGLARKDIVTFDAKDTAADVQSTELLLKNFSPKILIVSPGVPLSSPWIQEFKTRGGRITSELEIAYSFLTSEKVIGITGSIGKSTTTALLGAGVAAFSKNSFVGGNLGFPLANYATEIISGKRVTQADWVILELSSYQLENFSNLSCDFSAITYFTPNHMERYSSLEEYYKTKLTLVSKTKHATVFNRMGGDLFNFTSKSSVSGASIAWADRNSDVVKKFLLDQCLLIGKYNVDNLAVAATIAELAAWPATALEAMKQFKGLPHRLENLGVLNGVQYVNDSKATTINSVIEAVQTVLPDVAPGGRLVVLMGGHDKNLPWENLRTLSSAKNLLPIFFGEFGSQAQSITQLEGPVYKTLSLALKNLGQHIKAGDTVLLSPGGTSHDEFNNFEERGDFFKKLTVFGK